MARRLDGFGLVLAGLVCGWTLVTARGAAGSRPLPVLGAVVLCAGMFVAGRLMARRHLALPGGVASVAIAGAVVITWPGLRSAGGAPLGYGNANAVLCGLGAVAAASAAAELHGRDRTAAASVAALLAAGIVVAGSVGAVLALAVSLAVAAAAWALGRAYLVVVLGASVVVLALGLTVAAGLRADDFDLNDTLEQRTRLWSAALDMIGAHPLDGVGPGRFAAENPVTTDPDLRWAHHGFLQQGAEQGVVGFVLLLGVVGWGFAQLWGAEHGSAITIMGAVALTMVALVATVDHVLDEPAVTAVTTLLVGGATLPTGRPTRAGRGTRPSVPSMP